MDGNDHFYCRSFCRHSRRVLEQYRQFADIRRTLRTGRTRHFVLQLRNGNYYKCYKNAELNHKALYTPNIRGFKIIIGGINMKTKQILYLCIAGLIIAMIILSILPIWTFANYPKASAATEEEVNTDYNYMNYENKNGIFYYKTETGKYPKFEIAPGRYNNENYRPTSININFYTNANANIYYKIHYMTGPEDPTVILKNYENKTIKLNLDRNIYKIFLEIDMSKLEEGQIILGEFTISDGTTTYGYYYPEAKSLLNSLYENAYEQGQQDGYKKEVQIFGFNPDVYTYTPVPYENIGISYNESSDTITIDPNKNIMPNKQVPQPFYMNGNEKQNLNIGQEYKFTSTIWNNVKEIWIAKKVKIENTAQTPYYKAGVVISQQETTFTMKNPELKEASGMLPNGTPVTGMETIVNPEQTYILIVPTNPQNAVSVSRFAIYSTNEYQGAYYEGYDKGYNQGYTEGNSAGYESGYNKGHSEGYDDGLFVGRNENINKLTGFDIAIAGFRGVFQALDVDIFYGKVSLIDIFNIFFIIMVVTAVLTIIRG